MDCRMREANRDRQKTGAILRTDQIESFDPTRRGGYTQPSTASSLSRVKLDPQRNASVEPEALARLPQKCGNLLYRKNSFACF